MALGVDDRHDLSVRAEFQKSPWTLFAKRESAGADSRRSIPTLRVGHTPEAAAFGVGGRFLRLPLLRQERCGRQRKGVAMRLVQAYLERRRLLRMMQLLAAASRR